MCEKFTQRVRQIFDIANMEAKHWGKEAIGTEHMLIALVVESNGIAANILRGAGLTLSSLREALAKINQPPIDKLFPGKLPQTAHAKRALEYAISEMQLLGHSCVGTEHLLLGILREQKGNATTILKLLGVSPDRLRENVLLLLGHDLEQKPEEKNQDSESPQLKCKIFRNVLDCGLPEEDVSKNISVFLEGKTVEYVLQSSTSKETHISVWYKE